MAMMLGYFSCDAGVPAEVWQEWFVGGRIGGVTNVPLLI